MIYPFNNCFNIKKYLNLCNEVKYCLINPINVYNKEYDYYCPSYPSGFVIKLSLLNNYGSNDYIGLDQIKLFDENNNEIIMLSKDDKKENIPEIYSLPENHTLYPKFQPIFLTKYINIKN